jgi:hypothetical protein
MAARLEPGGPIDQDHDTDHDQDQQTSSQLPGQRQRTTQAFPRDVYQANSTATREVFAFLSSRPWLQLDVVDIILATQYNRKDVVHAITVLHQAGRIASHLRDDRVCYSPT